MKKVSFHTLGCKVNFAESSTLAREFEAAGFERVGGRNAGGGEESGSGIPLADVYVVNTCSVTAAADKKCRNLIARLHRRSPSAVIAVTGCWVQLNPRVAGAMPGVDFVFGNNFKDDISDMVINYELGIRNHERSEVIIDRASTVGQELVEASREGDNYELGIKNSLTSASADGCKPPNAEGFSPIHCAYSEIDRIFPAYSAGDRTRSFLKVQDGCDYRCAYCTIHYARGRSRNIPIAKAVEQAREIASRGVKEIVLTGINTGDFGRTTGERFIDLLRTLDDVEGIERYRISSIEPNLLTDGIIDFCAASRKFQPHFHIPLQSGSNRILGLMRRRYTVEKFADRVARVRERMPETFFGIDVIVGFPGEKDADFEETYRFLAALAPAQLHVFPFSARPGTPAAEMPDKVSPGLAAARAARLGELSEKLHAEFTAKYAGTRAKVLFEAERKDGMMYGFTENYIRVGIPYDPALAGTIFEIYL